MGLLDDLAVKPAKDKTCTVRDILFAVSYDERLAILEAIEKIKMDDHGARGKVYSHQWLSDVLSTNGYTVSRTTISRHINRKCSCE